MAAVTAPAFTRPIRRRIRWGYGRTVIRPGHSDLAGLRRFPVETWHPMNVILAPLPDPWREDLYLSSPLRDATPAWAARVTDDETGDLVGLLVETPPGAWPAHAWHRGELAADGHAAGAGGGRYAAVDREARLIVGECAVSLDSALDALCRTVRRRRETPEDLAALEGLQ
ncbi:MULTISPECIES: hypothetical protein [Methylobacteriaceae]|jgi:hypothetical protein|uniref:Uncharacterized protein n=5 Tax=Methylobacteriaceae TaxID=119045 RepID=A0A564FSD3_9HYPH|nr:MULTISPECIES: hypothetical protein [Methylobacteriaceae]MBY0141773.1 hypothetical protein [Methylorubrum populi]MCX7329945.1 hypothetical protein [Hyphomicrobiales bacterium]GJE69376.1 hypothetical protein CHKEEEPN_0901 [Methylorubrum podarium]MBB5760853.1 hypothetical protein [Methylorubrum rhodesianum]MBK3403670.1 hypothetical protein [Methylorubrum rhodesianum]